MFMASERPDARRELVGQAPPMKYMDVAVVSDALKSVAK